MGMFDPDPYEDQALIESLDGQMPVPPQTPEEAERLRKFKELIAQSQAMKPQSSRDVLDSVKPMPGGPTIQNAPSEYSGNWIERARTAETNRAGQPQPSGSYVPGMGAVTGAASSLYDSFRNTPRGIPGILDALTKAPGAFAKAGQEAVTREMVAPHQLTPPTPSSEVGRVSGEDPGFLKSLVYDTVGDPTNAFGGEADDAARLGTSLGRDLGIAAAGWFPPKLKKILDARRLAMKAEQREAWKLANPGRPLSEFSVKDAEIDTEIGRMITEAAGNPRKAEELKDAYATIALPGAPERPGSKPGQILPAIPPYKGVNFDKRQPMTKVLMEDAAGTATTVRGTKRNPVTGRERGVKFTPYAEERLNLAYEAGVERNKAEGWGDSRWLYHLSNGNPTIARQIARMLGATSPGQDTAENTLNGMEVWLRMTAGEGVDDILGRKVPGQTKLQGASISSGHPKPATVKGNAQRVMGGSRIFDEKVEALAGSTVGIHDKIPIDLWLMRAIGASSDVTPGTGTYRLIAEAMKKQADKVGEEPFEYMAKVWMGMQHIAGTPTPSFSGAVAMMDLPGHMGDAANRASTLANIGQHGAKILDSSLPETGSRSPIATNPEMPYEQWLSEVQKQFREGMTWDYLGKRKPVENPKDITWRSWIKEQREKYK